MYATSDSPQGERRATRKVLLSVALVGLVAASLAATWAAFSGTTSNSNNQFDTANVTIEDNDSGSAMFPLADNDNLKPGDTITSKCIKVTYTGDIAATVKLYGTTAFTSTNSLGDDLSVTVTRGTGTLGAGVLTCPGDFAADSTDYDGGGSLSAGQVYSGTLTAFPDSYAAGINYPASTPAGTPAVYKFDVTLVDGGDNRAMNENVTQEFTWEARAGS